MLWTQLFKALREICTSVGPDSTAKDQSFALYDPVFHSPTLLVGLRHSPLLTGDSRG
jgi:hypothetical protein